MSTDSRRFASLVLAAFEAAGNATDAEVAAAGGPSNTTMGLLRKVSRGEAEMSQPRNPTWKNIDSAAGWEPGSARRVWGGGDPTPVSASRQDDSYVAAPGEQATVTLTEDDIAAIVRNAVEEARRRDRS